MADVDELRAAASKISKERVYGDLDQPLSAWLNWAADQAELNQYRAPRHRYDPTEALAVARVVNRRRS